MDEDRDPPSPRADSLSPISSNLSPIHHPMSPMSFEEEQFPPEEGEEQERDISEPGEHPDMADLMTEDESDGEDLFGDRMEE